MRGCVIRYFSKVFLLSIIIEIIFFIMTPLKFELLPYIGIFIYSMLVVLVCNIIKTIIKKFI